MPYLIVRDRIEELRVDVILNVIRHDYQGDKAICETIFSNSGPELLEELNRKGGCEVGQIVLTGAYKLPCRYVMHTAISSWRGDLSSNNKNLKTIYLSALDMALDNNCKSIAIPIIDVYGKKTHKTSSLENAVEAIVDFLELHEMMIFLVANKTDNYAIRHEVKEDVQKLFEEIETTENKCYVPQSESDCTVSFAAYSNDITELQTYNKEKTQRQKNSPSKHVIKIDDKAEVIDRLIRNQDESFQQMLMRKISERGFTDAQCYKRANIDRKLFSKIRSDVNYKPSKPTAVAFAVALELTLGETEELLGKAGFALSRSNKFDIIIRYFIEHQTYSVTEINEVLFYYDQSLLGG